MDAIRTNAMDDITTGELSAGTGTRPEPALLHTLTLLFGSGAVMVGLLGIAGLYLRIPVLTRVQEGYIAIAFLTAVITIVLGAVLILDTAIPLKGIVRTSAALLLTGIFVASAIELPLNILGSHFIAETWFVSLADTLFTGPTSHISPVTVSLFIPTALGLILLLYARDKTGQYPHIRNITAITGLCIFLLSFTFVMSYVYGTPYFYRTRIIPIAFTTALGLSFLGLGLMTGSGESAIPLRYALGQSTRALLIRTFLPLTIAIILILFLIHEFFSSVLMIDNALFLGIFLILSSIVTSYAIARVSLRVGNAIDTAEGKREQAEQELRRKHEELNAAYEQLAASEEELRENFEKLVRSEEGLREREERYRTILRTAMDGFCIVDTTGRFVEMNDAFCRMLGYPMEEMRQMSLAHIEAKENREDIAQHIRQIIRTGADRFETRYRCKDNAIIDIEVSVVYSETREHFITFHHDITRRKRVEKILRETNMVISQAQELAHVGSWHYDLKENVISWSDELYRIFGYLPGEFNPDLEHIRQRIHPDDLEKHDRILAQAAATHVYEPGEYRILRPDGTRGYISTKGSVDVDTAGTVTHLMGVVQDITERKLADEKIQLANRNLALMTDVTYQDIQNKVTALRAYVELMRDPASEKDRDAFLNAESEILETIHNLIRNTKDFQKMGVNQPRWMPVEKILRQEASVLENVQNAALEIRLDGLEIWSDPLIGRVFHNIMDNSVKHGKTLTRISFGYRVIQDGLVLICEDNGVGIAGDEKSHIFDRVVAGEGKFGLFFVHEFLTISGMTIRETGEGGKGARFEITVPKGLFRFAGTGTQASGSSR